MLAKSTRTTLCKITITENVWKPLDRGKEQFVTFTSSVFRLVSFSSFRKFGIMKEKWNMLICGHFDTFLLCSAINTHRITNWLMQLNVLHMQHHVPYIPVCLFIWLQIVYCDSTDFIYLLLRPMSEIESYLSIQLWNVMGLAQGPTDGLGVMWFELT